jgi:hypothetical protein
MIDELTRNLRIIHDLERAIRVWERVRDRAQQVVNAHYEKQGGSIDTSPANARTSAFIATSNAAIVAAKARIDELEKGD